MQPDDAHGSFSNHPVSSQDLHALVTEETRSILQKTIDSIGADEGSLWWYDQSDESLVVCINTGPMADELELKLSQTLDSGIVSMVFLSGEGVVANDVSSHPDHSKQIDLELSQCTQAMMVVPIYLWGDLRGVVSAVILNETGRFGLGHLKEMHDLSAMLSRYLEEDWKKKP